MYSTGKTYRAPHYHNQAARNTQPYAAQLRARLLELQDALNTADDAMRLSLTQRIAVLSAKFPELKGDTSCSQQAIL